MMRTASAGEADALRVRGDGSAPSSLVEARALIDPALRAAVAELSPEVARVTAYHLGLSDVQGRPSEENGGKAVRPALAILSARAAGGDAAVAVPGAVAVELVHNFSLLHDDVMDGDRERRHRPTAWTVFGVGPAIVAGDALVTLAQQTLLAEATPARLEAARVLALATGRMIGGQARDLAFESRLDVSVRECLDMAADKTGALLSCSASIGAILAGASDESVAALSAFGLHLGLAFQAIDDILGIWGEPEVTGKPSANDLRQRKKTLPLAFAMATGGAHSRRLVSLLRANRLDEDQVALAVSLVEDAGGRARTSEEAGRQTALALEALDRAGPVPGVRGDLEELARFLTNREF
jgi:geranylgeranyl diphosphate synthase, type I